MRRDVKKLLIWGGRKDRDLFFARAQEFGSIEFIDPDPRHAEEYPEELSKLIAAKKVLRKLPPLRQEELEGWESAGEIADRILELDDLVAHCDEEIRLLRQEIIRIHVFGDFSLEDLQVIQERGNRVLQFFFAQSGRKEEKPLPPEVFYVGSAFDLEYFVAINRTKKRYPGLTEMEIAHPMGELRDRLKTILQRRRLAWRELKSLEKRRFYLEQALIYHLNQAHLTNAQEYAALALGDSLFVVEGWIPVHRMDDLEAMLGGLSVQVEEIAIEPEDRVPTALDNEGDARIGEDLVHIYDTPSRTDRDPSRWVLWAFASFFAIIMADAGYGLILLATSLYLTFRLRKRVGLARRFASLALILSTSAVLWGVFTNAWFGIQLDPDNPLRKISFTNALVHEKVAYAIDHPESSLYKEWVTDFPQLAEVDTVEGWLSSAAVMREGRISYTLLDSFSNDVLLEIALMIGVLHLCLAFLRVLDRNWAGIGWILFLIGGYLYFPHILDATSMAHYWWGIPPDVATYEGLRLIILGVSLAVLLALIQKRLKGAGEIINLIQIFADGLSYLRLYALGLASAMMSLTFNDIAGDSGIFFGVIILFLGHSVNLTLAIVAGVIHGLRLNFLEWYRHCFDGGGKMLAPLRLLEIPRAE